ncbi:hypothetical protein HID58_042560 [Brassica napus]|uniref:RNase H type-1 domain-containing protein n=1 Tax=Brassica napus TaxID=3708 RepID=A0ABQ8BE17_BRANA|nr:hypothetical protein HID58_042560 [Brassica napus]
MFPELSKEDRQAAMMYVSHADETERRARILRVQHSIENAKDDDTSVPIRISHNLNKDKGLVFGYSHGDDSNSESNNTNTLHAVSAPALLKDKEDRAATSGEQSASSNFQINGSTVFRLGNTTSSGYTGTSRSKRIDRKRPPAWVRRVRTNRYGAGAIAVSQGAVQPMEGSGKRKPEDNKESLQRGRFYFDKRMFGKRGVEEAIIRGWEAENDSSDLSVLDRIAQCRTELAKLKKASDWNSKTKIERLQTELEKESSKRKIQSDGVSVKMEDTILGVYNSNEGDSNTRSVFPWLVWELWKARNALAFENKTVTAYTIASRDFEEASSWQKTMILKSNTEIVDDVILRGEDGQTIMHSRRSYSFMRSKAEADLWAMHWAVECMHNTHHVNVIFEASSEQLHNVLSEPFHHLEFTGVVQSINQLLNGINGWSLNHALQERNEAAATIVVSVTRDRRYQSYMAQHEPAWLHHMLALEASSN